MKIKHSIILTCFIGIIVLFFPLISRGAPVCQGNCVPDDCNKKCPAGCTSTQDPDCGCQPDNDCCGIGCDGVSDNDCTASACSDYSQCLTGSEPRYCNSSGNWVENSGACGCRNGWVPEPNNTYCCDNLCNGVCSKSGCTAAKDPDCGSAGCCGNGVCNAGENHAACPADCDCTESWSCEPWSTCVGGNQTQKCTDANTCGTAVNKPGTERPCDSTPPVVTFTLLPPSTASSFIVSFTVSAFDVVGVTGYLITESSDIPLLSAGWNGTVPTSYTFTATGPNTLYVWAKDDAGNVSVGIRRDVTITLPVVDTTAPVVTAFTATANQTAVSVAYTVTDNLALKNIEIWRAPYNAVSCNETVKTGCAWLNAKTDSVAGILQSGSFTDNPEIGVWLYGIHVLDQAGNMGREPNPPGPIKVIIAAACITESDTTFCSRLGKNCGSVTANDNCLESRTVNSCGTCTGAGVVCGGGGTANVCGCTPSNLACGANNCGSASDGCGGTISCGSCISPQACSVTSGAGTCGCAPESDATFCLGLGKNCGSVTANDNCLESRDVADCSLGMGCALPETCGINNVCACSPVCPLPSEVCAGVTDTRADGCNGNGSCSVVGIETGCPDIVILNPAIDDEILLAGDSLTFRVFINPLISPKIVNIKNNWIQIIVKRLKVGTRDKIGMSYDDTTVFSAHIFDDGNHDDGTKGDNIWGATWQAIEEPTASGLAASFAYHYAYILGDSQSPSSILRWLKIAAKPACVAVLNPEETNGNGDPSQRIDVVYLSAGDGVKQTASDLAADALSFKNKLLEYEPFKTQKAKMNFWRVDTPMNCTIGYGGCARCIECNAAAVKNYAMDCQPDSVGVIVNTTTYSGTTHAGYFASWNGLNRDDAHNGPTVGVHELGHEFGKFFDEYNYGMTKKFYDDNKYAAQDWVLACNGFPTKSGALCPSDPIKVLPYISQLALSRNCNTTYTFTNSICGAPLGGICQGCAFTDWWRPLYWNTMMFDQKGPFNVYNIARFDKLFELLLK